MRIAWTSGKLPPKVAELGKSREGTWFAAADDDLVALMALDKKIRVLYLSRAEYDQAMRRLEPAKEEIARAVALRVTTFGDKLVGIAEAELARRKLPSLALADAAHFERSLELLVRLTTAGAFDSYAEDDRIDRLHDEAWGLVAELTTPETAALAAPGELDLHRGFAADYAAYLRQRGRKDYGRYPLHVTIERAFWVVPPEPGLVEGWRKNGIPRIEWNGGVVGPIPAHQVAETPGRVELLFPDWRTPVALRIALTPKQLPIALEDQLARADRGLPEHLASVRLQQLLARRAVAATVQTPALAAILARHLAAETAFFRDRLRERPAWGTTLTLLEHEQALVADAAFLSRVAALAPPEWASVALSLAAAHQALVEGLEKIGS